MKLEYYWRTLPNNAKYAYHYTDLCEVWGVKPREARRILHALATYDDGTDEILIRSTKKGFFKTANKAIIAEYRKEVYNRGRNVFACLKKIDRVLKQETEQYSFGNNIRLLRNGLNMTQSDLAEAVGITRSIVACMEDGMISPSYELTGKLADIFGVTVEEVVTGI